MGRPIKKRFFGVGTGSQLVGGESVASLAVHGGNSFSAGTTITFPTPPGGGSAATATITFVAPAVNGQPGNGNVASVTLTSAGSGYTVRNTVATFNKPANVVVDGVTAFYNLGAAGTVVKFSSGVTSGISAGMVANVFFGTVLFGEPTKVVSVNTTTGNITFSSANTSAISSPINLGDVGRLGNVVATIDAAVTTGNTIQGNAFLTAGAGGRVCDIGSQRSSRRYRVTNDQGTGVVRLISATECTAANTAGGPPTAGTMTITATDSTGGTYWVTKIDSRTATVTPGPVATAGTQFVANSQVIWSMNAAVVNTTVKLATND